MDAVEGESSVYPKSKSPSPFSKRRVKNSLLNGEDKVRETNDIKLPYLNQDLRRSIIPGKKNIIDSASKGQGKRFSASPVKTSKE